jgi:fructokinase
MRIGIDLGGTKIEIVALDDAGEELLRHRVPTPAGDYDATIRAISDLIAAAEGEIGETGTVGVAIPGAISPATGLVKNANSTVLIGHSLREDLEAALARPVRLANDADCFVLSEATDGAAAGARTVFGVIMGTGCGGGIVVDGALVSGPNAIAGEWGHNPLPWPDVGGTDPEWPGPRCYCGRTGCIETFLSGPGLAADHRRHGGTAQTGVEVVQRASRGDAVSRLSLERLARRTAKALASVINILDPHVIVLGGGLSNIDMLYERVPALWSGWVFSDRVDTRLVQNHHGDSSGVRGAAWLWPLHGDDPRP